MDEGSGRLRQVNELVLERQFVRGTLEWPPLESPGWAPLDIPGNVTECWRGGSGAAMTLRDLVD